MRLLAYFVPHKKLLMVILFGLMVFSVVDAGMIYFIQPLIDDGLAKADGTVLKVGAMLVVAIFVVRGIASFISNYTMAYLSAQITFELRQQAFGHLQYLPLCYFQQHSKGALISKITYDAEQISRAISEVFIVVVRETIIIAVLLAVMIHASWQLSLIFLVIGPVIGCIISWVSKRFRQTSIALQNTMGEVTKQTEQSINNHKEVLAFNTQSLESQRFETINRHSRQQSVKLASALALSNPVIQLIASLAIAGVLLLASLEGILGQLSVGSFTTTLVAMGSLLRPLKLLSSVNQPLQRGLAAAGSIFSLLDEDPEPDQGKNKLVEFRHSIDVRQLVFRYPGSAQTVLNKINFTLFKGQTLAIVGESGSGKSSLTHLLLRFFPPCEGHVAIDGTQLENIGLASLRDSVALVSQQIMLIDDTIAANIAYGCAETTTKASIERAARAAEVWDFAQAMPAGLESRIGENGSLLSGGQRQRIAIARAILKDAPILVLDEATSSLDTGSERLVQRAIARIQIGKTTIIIAHRLHTIKHADQILVLQDGEVKEQGHHAALLQQKGIYHRLYNQQEANLQEQ